MDSFTKCMQVWFLFLKEQKDKTMKEFIKFSLDKQIYLSKIDE